MCCCILEDNFQYFTNLLNSKLISELVQVIKQFSCVFLCNTIKTNFDKRNNFNLRLRSSKFQ